LNSTNHKIHNYSTHLFKAYFKWSAIRNHPSCLTRTQSALKFTFKWHACSRFVATSCSNLATPSNVSIVPMCMWLLWSRFSKKFHQHISGWLICMLMSETWIAVRSAILKLTLILKIHHVYTNSH